MSESYLVKHYMRKEVPTIVDVASVSEAAKTMKKVGRGFLIVLKGGSPAGIVTYQDVIDKIVADDKDPKAVRVGEIMSTPLITVDPDEDLLKASELMQKNNIRRLPVVKEGIIYGMITAADISKHCIDYVDKSVKDILRWAIPIG
jgi:CBS domain-containing protein